MMHINTSSTNEAAAAQQAPEVLLTLNSIAKSFGGLHVLSDISFSIPANGIIGLIGPNGSGKTTLFNIISGFISSDRGELTFNGIDITGMTVPQRCRQGIVRTFQTPKLFESLTALENVMTGFHKTRRAGVVESLLGSARSRREMSFARESAANILEALGIAPLADFDASRLTAGQRRSVEIARALASKPRLLMLDEPSTGLTREETFSLASLLERVREDGIAVLVVSHDMEFIRVTERTHVLYFGKIIASGDVASLQADPTVRQVYLGN